MDREQLEIFLKETYSAETDCPWASYPDFKVFRHGNNKKWFALMMNVSKSKLGMDSDELLDIVNFKCESFLVSSLQREKGFFPAYHMSKTSWITAALDGTADDDKIKMLADMSYELTKTKVKKKRKQED